MRAACDRAIAQRIDAIAFGDLFLRDVRAYREKQLLPTGLEPMFPLWNIRTGELAREMIAAGLRAKLVCVDTAQLPPSFAGRNFDDRVLSELPHHVDPCGERGEFHSCAYAGPMFTHSIALKQGTIVQRGAFVYADFHLNSLPENATDPM